MATIVNTPASSDNSSGALTMLMGLGFLLVLVILFFYFGLPMLNRATQAPQVNIPDQVDVNVNGLPQQPSGQ